MMRERWDQLSERDQWALIAGAIALAFFMTYQFIYAPLINAVAEQSQLLQEQNETLQWMQSVRNKIPRQGQHNPQSLDNSRLLAVINQQLAALEFKHFPFQLEQSSDTEIRLSFEQVPAAVFMQWLWNMQKNYKFDIKQLHIERLQKPGTVKLTLILEPAA